MSRRREERVCCFFFFQAEDGIRDYKVTGVQTCALTISELLRDPLRIVRQRDAGPGAHLEDRAGQIAQQLRAPSREAGFLASAHEAVIDRGHQPGHGQLSMVTMCAWILPSTAPRLRDDAHRVMTQAEFSLSAYFVAAAFS